MVLTLDLINNSKRAHSQTLQSTQIITYRQSTHGSRWTDENNQERDRPTEMRKDIYVRFECAQGGHLAERQREFFPVQAEGPKTEKQREPMSTVESLDHGSNETESI